MKSDLSILIIDRPLTEMEKVVRDIFMVYGNKYDLIAFLPKEGDRECRIQIVSFKYSLISDLQILFNILVDYDMDDPDEFFDFDLTQIETDVFYDVLSQRFEIQIFNLTDVEKK